MRPYCYLNLAISLDGKITTADRKLHGFGGAEDRDLMDELRAGADAVLLGAATIREEDPELVVRSPVRIAARIAAGREPQPWSIAVSPSLRLPPADTSKFFNTPGVRKFIFTTDQHDEATLAPYRGVADIQIAPDGAAGVDLVEMIRTLHVLGVRRLLLEGGGKLNFAMMASNLVDEINLTLCPMIFGGAEAPSAVAGTGFAWNAIEKWKLSKLIQGAEDRLFLTYHRVDGEKPR